VEEKRRKKAVSSPLGEGLFNDSGEKKREHPGRKKKFVDVF